MAAIRDSALVVRGYTELVSAFAKAEEDVKNEFFELLREVGDIVRADASARFAPYNARSAAGFRTVAQRTSVDVRQSLTKTTGQRPDYGALQITKALLPALDARSEEIREKFEELLDQIVTKDF